MTRSLQSRSGSVRRSLAWLRARRGLQEGGAARSSTRRCRSSSATSSCRPRRPAPSSPTRRSRSSRRPRARSSQLNAETGQLVKRGAPLVRIDPRNARNTLAQAQADLDVAQAKLTNATSQKRRADELFKTQSITEQEHEQALLDYANAKARWCARRVAVDNAKIQLEDTDVRAPITGTIIEKDVERGTVIASATANVSGGTTLLKMADLNLVQVRTLVDETDIGQDPARPARHGHRRRVPQPAVRGHGAQDRAAGADRAERHRVPRAGPDPTTGTAAPPGHEHRGRDPRRRARDSVLAVPNAALRTQRDVGSAAQVLGPLARGGADSSSRRRSRAARRPSAQLAGADAPGDSAGGGATDDAGQRPRRRTAARRDRGADPGRRARSADSGASSRPRTAVPDRCGRQCGRRRAGGAAARGTDAGGGRYIVFVKRHRVPTPVWIRTGLTDLDYSEVLSGLQRVDSV